MDAMASKTVPVWALAAALVTVALAAGLALTGARIESPPGLLVFLGRFHPVAVHAPIGVILLAALLEVAALTRSLRSRIDPALDVVLCVMMATTLGAFALGVALATEGGHSARLLALHRWLAFATVAGVGASFVSWAFYTQALCSRVVYRSALGVTLAALTVGAHYGGSMTHGEGYLTAHAPAFVRDALGIAPLEDAPPAAADSATGAKNARVFADVVAPVLQAKCVECHGPARTKGGLRVDSFAALARGGDGGPALPSEGRAGSLVERISLPLQHEEHMPPEDSPQLTPAELQLLRWWVERGASETLRVRDVVAPSGAHALLSSALAAAPSAAAPSAAGPPNGPPAPAAPAPEAPAVPPPSEKAPSNPVSGANRESAFLALVAPLLLDRCGDCHAGNRAKGKLRIDTVAALLTGGRSGPAVIPGAPERGTLLARVLLPLSDEKHMPPEGEPQLEPADLALLRAWIRAGANEQVSVDALPSAVRSRRPPPGARAVKTRAHSASDGASSASEDGARSPSVGADSSPTQAANAREFPIYERVVAPLFKAKCASCHGPEFPSGGLNTSDYASLLAERRIVPGDPDASRLLIALTSPLDDPDHMPPPKEPQPTPAEIAAVRLWIASGGEATTRVFASELAPELAGHSTTPSAPPATSSAHASAAPSSPASAVSSAQGRAPHSTSPRGHAGCASCSVIGAEPWGRFLGWLLSVAALTLAYARRRSSPRA
jgi:mono/diheme cytochrome c family protein